MKSLYGFVAFLFMNLCAYSQHVRDTTVTINANSKIEITLPGSEVWERGQDSCINFDYPTPNTIILTSKCRETRTVTLKRVDMLKMQDEPLLDVPRPKKQ